MATISSAPRTLALEAIRISNDFRLLSSGPNTGLGEIQLPALQPGSSIMPGKINPVLPELTAMVGFQVIGLDTAVAYAVQAGQLELNVMMPTMSFNVLQSIRLLTNTLHQLDHLCIRGITANRFRCEQYVPVHRLARHRAQPLHWLRERRRDRERIHRHRPQPSPPSPGEKNSATEERRR